MLSRTVWDCWLSLSCSCFLDRSNGILNTVLFSHEGIALILWDIEAEMLIPGDGLLFRVSCFVFAFSEVFGTWRRALILVLSRHPMLPAERIKDLLVNGLIVVIIVDPIYG